MTGVDSEEFIDCVRLLAFHLRCLGDVSGGVAENRLAQGPYRRYAQIFDAVAEELSQHQLEIA